MKECIAKELPLNERIIKDIHAILMENIFVELSTEMLMYIYRVHNIRLRPPMKCTPRSRIFMRTLHGRAGS